MAAINPWTFEPPTITEADVDMDHILTRHDVERGQSKKGAFNTDSKATIAGWLQKALNECYRLHYLKDAWAAQRHEYWADVGEAVGWSRSTGESTNVIGFFATISRGGRVEVHTAYPR